MYTGAHTETTVDNSSKLEHEDHSIYGKSSSNVPEDEGTRIKSTIENKNQQDVGSLCRGTHTEHPNGDESLKNISTRTEFNVSTRQKQRAGIQ